MTGQTLAYPRDTVTIKHATATVYLLDYTDQWRLGLIQHPRFGKWMPPGGHVEHDETPAEAVLREVIEETGLSMTLLSAPSAPVPVGYSRKSVPLPWWIVEHPVPTDGHTSEPHIHVDHLYLGLARSAEAQAEHLFRWYTVDELDAIDMFDDSRDLATILLPAADQIAGGIEPPADLMSFLKG